MHTLMTLFAALTTTLAQPLVKRLAENEPWHITNLAVFSSFDNAKPSSISFDVLDNNAGLRLNTTCSRSVSGPIEDANGFYPCANTNVNFRWDGSTLRLQRFYIDTNVGPCPQYCRVTVYGNGQPELVLDYLADEGKGMHQDALDIAVTEMVA